MTKHTYTESEAPMNTGSITHPARFNWRMDCQTRGRFWSDVDSTRKIFNLPDDLPTSEVIRRVWLPIVEHVQRNIVWGSALESQYCRSLADALPRSDYLAERARRMVASGAVRLTQLELF